MPATHKKHRSPYGRDECDQLDSPKTKPESLMTDVLADRVSRHRQQLVSWEDVIGRR